MDYKTFPFELVETKAGENGHEFSGYVSTFQNLDHGADIVETGAFDRTLRERDFRPLLWAHDDRLPPIGIEKSLVVDEKGLLGTWEILDSQLGRDVYAGLKAGAIRRMSMGYFAEKYEIDQDGIRHLQDVELLESSVVNIPMNEQAEITNVKAVWSAAYVNNLPDSAFAVILPGGEKDAEGKTTPRSLRKLPHHNAEGKLDEAHLNNALAREPQTDMSEALHAKAKAHLQRHKGSKSFDELLDTDVSFEDLFGQLKGWLIYGTDEAEALLQRRASDPDRSPAKRKLNDVQSAAIRGLLDTAKAQSERLEALIALDTAKAPSEQADDESPLEKSAPAINLRLELARRRLAMRGLLEQSA